MRYETTIPFEAVPNKAPMVTRNGTYQRPECKKAVLAYQEHFKATWTNEPMAGPISLYVWFHMKRPKCHKNTKHHVVRPDKSNLSYLLENSMKGIIIADDSKVVHSNETKLYAPWGEEGYITLVVEELDD
jgi:Holliday junction resolvase RusA-like endonuclease